MIIREIENLNASAVRFPIPLSLLRRGVRKSRELMDVDFYSHILKLLPPFKFPHILVPLDYRLGWWLCS